MPNAAAEAPASERLVCRPLPGKCDCVLGGRGLVEPSGGDSKGPRALGALLDVALLGCILCLIFSLLLSLCRTRKWVLYSAS